MSDLKATRAFDVSAVAAELVSIRDLVRWGVSYFNQAELYYGHGMANALDEAVFIALSCLNLPQNISESYFDSRLMQTEREVILRLYQRRIEERTPAAYLTHEAWFAGLKFYVDENVLVPRSPIAELIENRFQPWIDPEQVEHVLDLCTGSGCIGIACAYAFDWAQVDLADISTEALEVAEKNIQNHQLQEQVTAYQSDLFSALAGNKYDIIVSNPPYVDAEDMAALPDEFRREPELGLAAGDDGLDLVKVILKQAANHLNPGGILVVEVGNSQYALEQMLPQVGFYWLEFERGGDGVFLLSYEQLEEYQHYFEQWN
ncbi:MAG: 50S ribosomal protein L3 N(5)-glutamine methyltransferase [Gammaproteobacteria bacterium]|nr:50S ribosomal protein L3 N(5)-glutamine methyltransferase [Gammaproteobacteria bacterium]